MIIKCLEIRDDGTCIAAIAIKMSPENAVQSDYLSREGYPSDGLSIILLRLSDQVAHSDPYDWPYRTMKAAHLDILDRFEELSEGDVVDVRVYLKETTISVEGEIRNTKIYS